ncbi:MAG: hypothetical protein M1830_008798 [Pleopsidium flavum]|nr:MAG: hypothetical protein M1830_008798 [Pleopsidium flavum]
MPLELSKASEDDLPRIIHVQFTAFADDAMSRIMFPTPTPASTLEKAVNRAREDMRNPDVTFTKVVDTDSGDIIAFGKWVIYKHERPEEEWTKETKRDWGEGTNVEAADTFIGAVNQKRRKIMAGKAHCLLQILDTLPSHQRRGAGTQLIKWGVDVGDKYGIPCYLEASPAGYHLYRKCGFEDVENLDMDLTKWGGKGTHRYVCMIRPAQKPE